MMDAVREVVIGALHKATGVLNTPERARALLSGEDLAFSEIDMDSLSLFEVIMEVEDRFGIELDADLVAGHEGVDAFVAYLKTRLG